MAPLFSLILLLSLSTSAPLTKANFLNTACAKTTEPKTCIKYLSSFPESKTLTSYKGLTKLSLRAFETWSAESNAKLSADKRTGAFYKPQNQLCVKICRISIQKINTDGDNLTTAVSSGNFKNTKKYALVMMNDMLGCDKGCWGGNDRPILKSFTDMSGTFMKLCKITMTFAQLEGRVR